MRVVFKSDTLIGDGLMMTPTFRRWKELNPDGKAYYWAPGDDTGIHVTGTEVIFENNPYLDGIYRGRDLPWDVDKVFELSCSEAFSWGIQYRRTLPEGFANQVGIALANIKYDYVVTEEEERSAIQVVSEKIGDRRFVIISRHSASCSSNDPKMGYVPNKCIPNSIWCETADWVLNKGYTPVAIGSRYDEQDSRYHQWPGIKLYGYPLRIVGALCKLASATLSIDNGIRHLAAAVGGNMYCLSGAIPLQLIRCVPVRTGQRIFEQHVPLSQVSRRIIVEGAKRVLGIE